MSRMLDADSGMPAVEELCREGAAKRGYTGKGFKRLVGCKPGPVSAGLAELHT